MSDTNHSTRTVLPLAAAVKGPRFSTTKHWEISSVAREVLDSFDLPLRSMVAPPVERSFDAAESIVMSGAEIINTMRTGSHSVKQRRTADLATLPELAIVEPEAYERTPAATLQQDADAALERINSRRARARRSHRLPRKPATAPRATRLSWIWTVIVVSVLVAAGILYSVAPLAR